MASRPRRRPPRKKVLLAIGAAVVVVVLVIGAGVAWFFGGDEPAEADVDTAAAGVAATGSSTTSSSASSSSSSSSSDGIAGTWSVDTETGEFDYESATGTFAGFRIAENLQSVGSTTAVGRTGDVTGTLTIEGTRVTAATFTADLTSITTNERRRDDKVQRALDTTTYPTATFVLTAPIDLGSSAPSGSTVKVTADGDLTIHGVTKRVQLPIEAKLVNGTIVLVASTDLTFSDYGVEVPTSPVVVSVDDHGTLEVQLLLTRS
jgi:polyisoprenoid-binding protein YceI